MKFSSRTVKKNAAKVAGFIIVILGFARGEKYENCPTFPCPGLNSSDLGFNYFLDDWLMTGDLFGNVCKVDKSLIPVNGPDKTWDHYKQAEYNFHLREKDVLTNPKYETYNSPGLRHARNLYSHCTLLSLETEEDDINSKRVLCDTIRANPTGRNPLNYDSDPSYDLLDVKDSWIDLDNYYVKNFGLSTFHHITKFVNSSDNKIVLVLAPPKLLIPEQTLSSLGPAAIRQSPLQSFNLMRSRKRQAYVDYIHHEFHDISKVYRINTFADSEEKQINRIEEMIDFEINLAKITQQDMNEIYNDDLSILPIFNAWQFWYNLEWMYYDFPVNVNWKKSPILYLARGLVSADSPCTIDWTRRVYSLVRSVVIPGDGRITDLTLNTARVYMKNTVYNMKLCSLLHTTKREVITNYINWNNYRNGLIRTKGGFKNFVELSKKMEFDSDFNAPRSLYCAKINVLKTPVHWVLMNEAKSYITPIKEKIRTTYKNLLTSLFNTNVNRFLFDRSKVSKKKLGNDFFSMPINVFGPERWLAEPYDSNTDVPKVPEKSTFFTWYIEQQKWHVRNALRLIDEPSDKTSWPVDVDRALVFVTKTEKSYELFLTGAILQPPFIGLNENALFNYAGIGVEIARILWDLVVFPVIKKELVTKAVHSMLIKCPSVLPPTVSTELTNEIFKNVHRSVDPVEIALEAYAQLGYLYDDGEYALLLQRCQRKVFLTAHIKTQCEKLMNAKPDTGRRKERIPGVYYQLRDFSTSNNTITGLKMSRFFTEVLGIETRCGGVI